MELSVKDRLLLANVLPKEGNILTLRVVKELQDKLAFSADDLVALGFKTENNRATWDESKAIPKDFEISTAALEVIKKTLNKMADSEKLPLDYLDLYDKVMK